MKSAKKRLFVLLLAVSMSLWIFPITTQAVGQTRPNILVIWGDDIGQSDVSCYTHGLMGYKTPNIDRIAEEGMAFTDYYGEGEFFYDKDTHVGRLDKALIEARTKGWTVVDMQKDWKVIFP